MTLHNLTDYDDLIVYHMNKTRDLLRTVNKDKVALYWSNEDTFYQKYQPGDVLVYWGLAANASKLTEIYPDNKYVMAAGDYYYIDCGFGNKYGGNAWCDPFKSWWRIYSFEPTDHINGTSVLGAEIPVWSELNSDIDLQVKLWPRGAAMSDKMWGPKVETDLIAITQRQVRFAQYLNERGTPTSPITGRWCEAFTDHCFAKPTTVDVTSQALIE